MALDTAVVAHSKRRAVHKGNPRASTHTHMQVGEQGHADPLHQCHKAFVAHQLRKFTLQVKAHIAQVEGFEVAILRLVKQDHYCHDLAFTQLAVP